MRRFMRRLLMLTCGVTGLAFALAIVLRHVEPPAQAQQPDYAEAEPLSLENLDVADAAIEEAGTGSLGIRQQYVELLRKKAELMSEEEITGELDRLKSDITELEASRALESITRQLQELIDSHPQTAAARRAQQMLAVPVQGDAPYYGGPAPTRARPVPDRGFEPAAPSPSRPTNGELPTY